LYRQTAETRTGGRACCTGFAPRATGWAWRHMSAFHDIDTDILADILAKMSVSVSVSWNVGNMEIGRPGIGWYLRNATSCCCGRSWRCRTPRVPGWPARSDPPAIPSSAHVHNKAIVNSRLRPDPRCDVHCLISVVAQNSVGIVAVVQAVTLSPLRNASNALWGSLCQNMTSRRHPRSRKYITYRNAAGGGPNHAATVNMRGKFVVRSCSFRDMQTDKPTDRQTESVCLSVCLCHQAA